MAIIVVIYGLYMVIIYSGYNSGYNTNNSGYNTNNSAYIWWLMMGCIYIYLYLVGGWPTNPEKWWSQLGWFSMTPTEWKVIQNSMVPVTTNQKYHGKYHIHLPSMLGLSWIIHDHYGSYCSYQEESVTTLVLDRLVHLVCLFSSNHEG